MTDRLIIALAQMNQRVGDLDGNAAAILAMRDKAAGADLMLCPELQLTGYPPEDLVLKPEFVRRTMEVAERLVDATAAPGPALLFGTIVHEAGANYNAMLLADGGRVIGRTLKRELPNYGTFDEKRVFAPGPLPEPLEFRGVKLGVPICEDIWLDPVCVAPRRGRRRDAAGPQRQPLRARQGRVAPEAGAVAGRRITGLPLAYLNRVGGQDELVFDGSSFVMHRGRRARRPDARLGRSAAAHRVERSARPAGAATTRAAHQLDPYPEDIYRAMMVALRDYVDRQRLSRRDPRPVGRHRQRAVGGGRGRCAWARQGVGRDDAIEIYLRRKPRGRRENARAARLPS